MVEWGKILWGEQGAIPFIEGEAPHSAAAYNSVRSVRGSYTPSFTSTRGYAGHINVVDFDNWQLILNVVGHFACDDTNGHGSWEGIRVFSVAALTTTTLILMSRSSGGKIAAPVWAGNDRAGGLWGCEEVTLTSSAPPGSRKVVVTMSKGYSIMEWRREGIGPSASGRAALWLPCPNDHSTWGRLLRASIEERRLPQTAWPTSKHAYKNAHLWQEEEIGGKTVAPEERSGCQRGAAVNEEWQRE